MKYIRKAIQYIKNHKVKSLLCFIDRIIIFSILLLPSLLSSMGLLNIRNGILLFILLSLAYIITTYFEEKTE